MPLGPVAAIATDTADTALGPLHLASAYSMVLHSQEVGAAVGMRHVSNLRVPARPAEAEVVVHRPEQEAPRVDSRWSSPAASHSSLVFLVCARGGVVLLRHMFQRHLANPLRSEVCVVAADGVGEDRRCCRRSLRK